MTEEANGHNPYRFTIIYIIKRFTPNQCKYNLYKNSKYVLVKQIANRCFENVSKFRYLETTITNQNLIQEEIKRRLNSGNACHHSVQNMFVFSSAV
jgi:hypothetical protein